jgi:thioredoxin-dependent peroxiredoxin
MTTEEVQIGAVAPDFVLPTTSRESWRLSDHRGKVVALLFYPKDETLVCTKQLCSVRDNWDEYLKTKAVIAGISPGTVAEHEKFASNHHLPLSLLADSNGEVTRLYTQTRWLPVWFTRAIVVIDAKGFVRTRKVMVRARRPTDYSVISSIYSAQTDLHLARYDEILAEHKKKPQRRRDWP